MDCSETNDLGKLLITILMIIIGAIGYLMVNFWFRPILRFKELRSKVSSDLIFYEDVINTDGLNNEMKAKLLERIEANRRHSADLSANYCELPFWYKWYLIARNINPQKASKSLMGLSNTFKWVDAEKKVNDIRTHLKIKYEQ